MASSKTVKKTRLSQYTQILQEKGIKFSNNLIYGFRFKTLAESYAFHYALMTNHVDYLLFDGATEKCKVFVTEENIENVRRYASQYHGEEYKPSALNDYE